LALVLAIEPDLRQAAIVKRVIKEKVQADVAVVDSRDAALEAIRARVPDVLLLSVLLSPRDEQELMAHLRALDNAEHLQTHTIPQLASSLEPAEEGQGLLGRFRRKKGATVATGCDPNAFADEVRMFLERAAEKKRERELFPQRSIVAEIKNAHPVVQSTPEPAAAAGSSWDSPFEWPASGRDASVARPSAAAESLVPDREPLIADRASLAPESIAHSDSLVAPPNSLLGEPDSFTASPDSPIRHSSLVTGSPVSSIHDRVEFPSTARAPKAAPPAPERVSELSVEPAPLPEPPPDTLAPFFMFDSARGLRRDAARWLRPDSGAPRDIKGVRRNTESTNRGLAMAHPIHVRIRTIRVQPAA
jgi:CheY-like chemotaxis protein